MRSTSGHSRLGARRNARILLGLVPVLLAFTPSTSAQDQPAGVWRGSYRHPQQGEVACELVLCVDGDKVTGGLRSTTLSFPLEGEWNDAVRTLTLTGYAERDAARVRLVVDRDSIEGSAVRGPMTVELKARRAGPAPATVPPEWVPVDLGAARPVTVDQRGLDRDVGEAVTRRIETELDAQHIVGLSAAFVLRGELADVRSFGWQDRARGVPATIRTSYRWASISKPLTAIAAMQLVELARLELDRDVRGYVPEFPEKPHTLTSRQLLCHQAGLVHYSNGEVIRTVRDYDVPHPFEDRVLSLDMFKESPLIAEPGTRYSYSTPGFVLLGAVVERAGGEAYRRQVEKRILQPLGMTTMQPDFEWVDIPQRTAGYTVAHGGRVYPSSGTDLVSWKLPSGGWTSSVADLGRFAAGIARGRLVSRETFEQMTTPQKTKDGKPTTYGLGFGVSDAGGVRTVSHSGSQDKTATYMLIEPGRQLAVCLMCNTEGTRLEPLANDLLALLREGS